MSTLVIVESPAKAKTIEKYLGEGYRVRASVGHIRDLPKSNKDAVDIAAGFVPRYVVIKGKEKVIADLRHEAKKADAVLLATDPDREGEAIAWHIAEELKDANKNLRRIVFHEITEPAVREALAHPREIDEDLRKAQEARRVLDRLVGYDLSGLIWKKVRYGLSAGRVQSPALRILMEREREIRVFKSEDFLVITALTETEGKEQLALTCSEEPREEKVANEIIEKGGRGAWRVTGIKETAQKRAPRPPFTTSTLQQTASTRLGFSPSRTMRTAQQLYEAGAITYMRTDSVAMSAVAQKQIIALISSTYGEHYVQPRRYKTRSKSAQEAHEAIRPTNFAKHGAGATDEQKKLYSLIFERAVASQMADAEVLRTKITATIAEGGIPDFVANGSRITFDGWLRADPRARGEDVEVPKVATADPLILLSIESLAKQTQPPSRYSEAGLIKELEKRGIGRPSTYASILKTLTDRGYAEKQGRTLMPSDTGDVISSFLEDHFAKYISDTFTSEMEDELDQIAAGTREYEKTLADFYTPFTKDIMEKQTVAKLTTLAEADAEYRCPRCGSKMVVKLGRSSKFLSCSRFPKCTGARAADGSKLKDAKPIGRHPESGENIYVKSGRFGYYVQVGEKSTKGNGAGNDVHARRSAGNFGSGKKNRGNMADGKAVKDKSNFGSGTASIPKDKKPEEVTVADALRYLSLPRLLGVHPESGKSIIANIGRFGPYIVHEGDFRSLKASDSPYDITLSRALAILKEEKKRGKIQK